MNKHQPYTSDELDFLKTNYPSMTQLELTKAFNAKFGQSRTKKAIAATCKRKGYKSGRTGCFEKGDKPWNTGTKGVCKPNSGSFTSEPRPELRAPIGHQRIDKDGYIWEKVEQPNKFRLKHQLIWEKQNGKIPKGMVLWFLDRNRENCSVDNLELISRQEQIRRNKLQVNQQPEEVQVTLKLVAKMQVSIAENKKAVLHHV